MPRLETSLGYRTFAGYRRVGFGNQCAIDGRSAFKKRLDLRSRHARFLQYGNAVLADTRRVPVDLQSGSVPPAGDADVADQPLGRMRSGLEELNRGQMRIVDQGVEIVHWCAGNIATFEERERLRSRQRAQNVRDDALHWIGFTGLAGKEEVLPAGLNLHERKFLELARALAARPKLLLLDEVLSGLNPAEVDNAIRLVRAIRAQGATIVFVEHLMRAVVELSDRVAVLNEGKLFALGAPHDVMRDPRVVSIYLGKAYAA